MVVSLTCTAAKASATYASTTFVLLKASCSGRCKKGIKKGSIIVSLSMHRSKTWYHAGLFPSAFLTRVSVIHFAGDLLNKLSKTK
jgi:hypothetical protein